jgi:hypothetical protein
MIAGSRSGTPNYLLSLNDTLTCGFGASLLLFFVFAVLVVFDETGRSNGEIGLLADASGRALRAEELAGDPQLYLRIASSDPEFIKAIVVPSPDYWMWQAEPILGQRGKTSLLVLHWTGAVPLHSLDFELSKDMRGTIHMTAMLGGTLLTPTIGMRHVHDGGTHLFTVNLRIPEHISFPDGP